MALAFLLSNLLKHEPPEDFVQLHAFIIDHGVRAGSRQEATKVSQWLNRMGIETSVGTAVWEKDPRTMSDFESKARRKRYRTLASLANQISCKYLLTGHHLDDQVETIMMRLVRGTNPSLLSLRGMQPNASVPECEWMRGIRNAEPSIPIQTLLGRGQDPPSVVPSYLTALSEVRLGQKVHTAGGWVDGLDHGGIELHRPLLAFTKSALIATCEANGIPYVRDKTNFDPTYTRRNAVRALRSHHKLPRALQDDSLLALSQKARDTLEDIASRGLNILRSISILAFDSRSGTAHLHIPLAVIDVFRADNNAAAYVMSKLASLINAAPADTSDTLAPGSIVSLMWRSLANDFWRSADSLAPPRFTYNNAFFEGVQPPKQFVNASTIWRLSRTPLTPKNRLEVIDWFQMNRNEQGESKWLFWDWRYWIRIKVGVTNSLGQKVLGSKALDMMALIAVRSYNITDAKDLKARLPQSMWNQVRDALHECAPGKIRYTLPVLTCNGEIIAFPTLFPFMIRPHEFQVQTRACGFGSGATLAWSVAYRLLPRNVSVWGSTASAILAGTRRIKVQQPKRHLTRHFKQKYSSHTKCENRRGRTRRRGRYLIPVSQNAAGEVKSGRVECIDLSTASAEDAKSIWAARRVLTKRKKKGRWIRNKLRAWS